MEDIERNKIYDQLEEEYPVEDVVSYNEYNVQDKLQEHAYILMEYNKLYNIENSKLENLYDKLEVLTGKQYDHYRFEYDRELTKVEIEKYYLPQDKKIRQLKRLIEKQKVRVEFFETALKGLRSMGWNMKTFCDNMKKGY